MAANTFKLALGAGALACLTIACSSPVETGAEATQYNRPLRSDELVSLSRGTRTVEVQTAGGRYAIPDTPELRRYKPAQDRGEPTTIVVMRIARTTPMRSDLPPSGESLIDAAQVTVNFNSEEPRPPHEEGGGEAADLQIGSRSIRVVGSNWNCMDTLLQAASPDASRAPPRFLPGRLLASWDAGGQRLHLSCTREVVPGREGVMLNCGGGTDEQSYGRMDFAAMDWGSGRCEAALTNLVRTLSDAPVILQSWKASDQ